MLKIFANKRKTVAEPVTSIEPQYAVCRSYYGYAFHIRDTAQEDGLTLCGTKFLDDRSFTTVKDVIAEIPLQHTTWFYCAKCAHKLTHISEEEIVSYREKRS